MNPNDSGRWPQNQADTRQTPPPAAPVLPESVWPPPPGSAVWPPPPAQTQAPGVWFPFRSLYYRVSGNIADFRVGTVGLGPWGVAVQGKVVPRAEVQTPILIVCFLLSLLVALIAYYIMEYGSRRDAAIQIPWENVRRVVLVPNKRRVGLAYDHPNYAGRMKTFTLAFSLDPALFSQFAETARQYVPDRAGEGKLRYGASLLLMLLLVVLAILLTAVFIAVIASGHSRP